MSVVKCEQCGKSINANTDACQQCGPNFVVQASPEDMLYYQIVRTTIQGLDSLRITTVVAGLTFNFALLTASAFVWQNIDPIMVAGCNVPIGCLAAILFAVIAAVLNYPFLGKIKMFNKFIKKSIDIAIKLEEISIRQDLLRLTGQFTDEYPSARGGGDHIFKVALWVMTVVSYGAGLFFAWRFIADIGKCFG